MTRAGTVDAGYTLIEMLLVLGIVTTVGAYALPSLHMTLLRSTATATINEMMGILETSRYLAMSSRMPVTVCAVQDGQCNGRWRNEILVFQDRNRNGMHDAGEVQRYHSRVLGRGFWLVWRPFRNSPHLTWAQNGQTDSMNGTFTLCHSSRRNELLRQLVINRVGRVRLVRPVSPAAVSAARRACGW